VEYIYRVHAIERMFQRDIEAIDIEQVVNFGEIIESYIDDKPYPSFLALGFVNDGALHVVYAKDEDSNFIIITAYKPNPEKWQDDFKTRKGENEMFNL
jgi:hypothetical protein